MRIYAAETKEKIWKIYIISEFKIMLKDKEKVEKNFSTSFQRFANTKPYIG